MSYLQALAVFIAVAEEKSFSAAAKKLSLTQPTVSFHIDGLERKFGCPLFLRTRRGAELTVYGRTLYENTRSVQDLLDRTERRLRDLCRGMAGQVTIGAGTIPGEYILPPLLAGFLRDHPGVSVNLVTGDSQTIYGQWQAGSLPICVVGFLPPGRGDARRVWTDEIVAVASPQLRLPDASWTAEDLCRYPMVLRHPASGSMTVVREALAGQGVTPERCHVVLQVSGNEALKKAAQAGAGLAFLSRRAVERELAEGKLVELPLEGLRIRRNFYALLGEAAGMPAVLALWQLILSRADAVPD